MRRLMMFLLAVWSVLSFLLMATPANAQGYGHHRRPYQTCISMSGECHDPLFRVIRPNRRYEQQDRSYGSVYVGRQDRYRDYDRDYGREPYYDDYGPQIALPRGPAVTGGVIGAMAGYAIRGDARGTVGGGAIGAGVGLILRHRNNQRDQRESSRQIVYETRQREYEQAPSNSVILVTNQTGYPVSLLNQTTNTYTPLAPGASTQVPDGNFVAIMDVKGEMFRGVITRSASGLVVNEPQVN